MHDSKQLCFWSSKEEKYRGYFGSFSMQNHVQQAFASLIWAELLVCCQRKEKPMKNFMKFLATDKGYLERFNLIAYADKLRTAFNSRIKETKISLPASC